MIECHRRGTILTGARAYIRFMTQVTQRRKSANISIVSPRASIGGGRGGGDASPHFSGRGDSIGIVPPTFQFRKIARHIA